MPTETQTFRDALLSLDRVRAETLFQECLAGMGKLGAVESLIVPALQEIGDDWEAGRLALSQVYMSGRICEELVTAVLSTPAEAGGSGGTPAGPAGAIAVLNDYHLLGKRIVLSVLRAADAQILDYGRMDVATLVDRVRNDRPQMLFISTLMLPAALSVRELRDALSAAGLAVRIAVGGAPFQFDPNLWRDVGADAVGYNAGDAIRILRQWTETA